MAWSFQELADWAAFPERLACFEADLLAVAACPWPETGDGLRRCAEAVAGAGADGVQAQLWSAALASRLLHPERAPAWATDWLTASFSPGDVGLPFSWAELFRWSWSAAPFVVGAEGRGRLIHALAGRGDGDERPLLPYWAADKLGPSSIRGVEEAARAARRQPGHADRRFFFWPQVRFSRRRQSCDGGSLGLAAYLGFIGEPGDARVVATGVVGGGETVGGVERLRRKYRAVPSGHAFLYSPAVGAALPDCDGAGARAYAVGTLREARFISRFHGAGCDDQLHRLYRARGNATAVAQLLDEVPGEALALIERNEGLVAESFSAGFSEMGLKVLIDIVMRGVLDYANHADMLHVVMDGLTREVVAGTAALGGLPPAQLCELKARWFSMRGDAAKSDRWSRLSADYAAHLSARDRRQWLLIRLHGGLVNRHHNRYDFTPEVPEDFLGELEKLENVCSLYERTYGHGSPDMEELAALYGTLAQHFAFCGPEYFGQVERCAGLCRRCFKGADLLPADRSRSYLLFAALDAGEDAAARQALVEYLGGESLDAVAQDDPQRVFKLFAAVRYAVDSGRGFPGVLDFARAASASEPEGFFAGYPWNLILCGLARLIRGEDRERAGVLLDRAWEISLAGEATVQAMALVPLSWRLELGMKDDALQGMTATTLDRLRGLDELCLDHFRPVLEAPDWQRALAEVVARRSRLFPFTYR
ncbi:hypothetical protein DND132_2483 [Pseudodesulfovibrio mercurii]|uniref:Uncharacterized protein n=1 Tax=Pseudodesulfovibrio mercurii TaxID=641491 RepID=F0JCK6_9BACT|nr:hypothetical protein [Pseudodesulfovibrio mercurii]EGB15686.1 hypothetical protein DND132_2483 [Pseudodesulfovibrio mercurii]